MKTSPSEGSKDLPRPPVQITSGTPEPPVRITSGTPEPPVQITSGHIKPPVQITSVTPEPPVQITSILPKITLPPMPVILITGGRSTEDLTATDHSAEIFSPNSLESSCILPELPAPYFGHTQHGGLLCG